MKRITTMICAGVLMAAGVASAAAQSLGDYARSVRKNKPEPTTATRHYDNDNLPTGGEVSVVGPAPSQPASTTAPNAGDAKAEQERSKAELQQKIDDQKQKVDSLNHELDLEQREYRLQAAAFYADAGTRLRDSAQWDKTESQYKSDVDAKQKAIDAAKQELENLQEQARKAGMKQKDETENGAGNNEQSK